MSTSVTRPNLSKENSLAELLRQPAYADRFKQVLGERAGEFTSSILSVGMSMPDVNPISIVQSAMKAAALDLPVEKSLGFAWIVPYVEKGVKVAQFQIGWKGLVQLALRTAAYSSMNVKPINAEALGGFDDVGEPIIHWDKVDETKEAIGYAFAWKLVNGFRKVCYWSKEKVDAHAKRYSQSYAKGYTTPWKTHFDQMAMKTVVKNELSKWGILSIQFQRALEADGSVTDSGGTRYPDGIDVGASTNEVPKLADSPEDNVPMGDDNQEPKGHNPPPTQPQKDYQMKPASEASMPPKNPMVEILNKPHQPEPPTPVAVAADPNFQSQPINTKPPTEAAINLQTLIASLEIPEKDFLLWAHATGRCKGANQFTSILQIPEDKCIAISQDAKGLALCKKTYAPYQQPQQPTE